MEIDVKICDFGDEQSKGTHRGMVIPREVLLDAVNNYAENPGGQFVHLGSREPVADISNIAAKIKKINLDSEDISATVETIPTPDGKILDQILETWNSSDVEIVPVGYVDRDENGVINHMQIIKYSIEPIRNGKG